MKILVKYSSKKVSSNHVSGQIKLFVKIIETCQKLKYWWYCLQYPLQIVT